MYYGLSASTLGTFPLPSEFCIMLFGDVKKEKYMRCNKKTNKADP